MIPFLVADRPISLSIIKEFSLAQGAQVGILTQAVSTSQEFKKKYASIPV
jgi:hypothetical protein